MSDSSTTRSRRARAHARGDHGGCDPARCTRAALSDALDTASPVPSDVSQAVADLVAARPSAAPGDARAVLAAVAVRLADALGSSPAASVAGISRELVSVLNHLEESSVPLDVVDDIRARQALRRAKYLLEPTQ